jgi:hypothetical protein
MWELCSGFHRCTALLGGGTRDTGGTKGDARLGGSPGSGNHLHETPASPGVSSFCTANSLSFMLQLPHGFLLSV